MSIISRLSALALIIAVASSASALDVPEYSSRPGAAYTMYLNFGGFSFNGNWGNTGKAPGITQAYSIDGDYFTFSTTERNAIGEIWARVAEKYSVFDINVTTLDPAIAAGQAASDSARQTHYDRTARMMHSLVGGDGGWYGPAGGVSYVGTTQYSYTNFNGAHTNFTFTEGAASNLRFVAEATAHEQCHGLGCFHQSHRASGQEYSSNDGSNGNGSFAPTMGNSYSSQRGLWREGESGRTGTNVQDDVDVIAGNGGMSIVDYGIGRSLGTATPLAFDAGIVDPSQARGIIVPVKGSDTDFDALGKENYSSDYFAFETTGGALELKLNAGSQRLVPGQADPGATFDGTLKILDSAGNVIGTSTRSASTMFSTYAGSLAAGRYYALIESFGGYTSTAEPTAGYYTMGSYFLTGSGNFVPVPEPATLTVVGLGLLFRRRRK